MNSAKNEVRAPSERDQFRLHATTCFDLGFLLLSYFEMQIDWNFQSLVNISHEMCYIERYLRDYK
jgi:hypothetical protein